MFAVSHRGVVIKKNSGSEYNNILIHFTGNVYLNIVDSLLLVFIIFIKATKVLPVLEWKLN